MAFSSLSDKVCSTILVFLPKGLCYRGVCKKWQKLLYSLWREKRCLVNTEEMAQHFLSHGFTKVVWYCSSLNGNVPELPLVYGLVLNMRRKELVWNSPHVPSYLQINGGRISSLPSGVKILLLDQCHIAEPKVLKKILDVPVVTLRRCSFEDEFYEDDDGQIVLRPGKNNKILDVTLRAEHSYSAIFVFRDFRELWLAGSAVVLAQDCEKVVCYRRKLDCLRVKELQIAWGYRVHLGGDLAFERFSIWGSGFVPTQEQISAKFVHASDIEDWNWCNTEAVEELESDTHSLELCKRSFPNVHKVKPLPDLKQKALFPRLSPGQKK